MYTYIDLNYSSLMKMPIKVGTFPGRQSEIKCLVPKQKLKGKEKLNTIIKHYTQNKARKTSLIKTNRYLQHETATWGVESCYPHPSLTISSLHFLLFLAMKSSTLLAKSSSFSSSSSLSKYSSNKGAFP